MDDCGDADPEALRQLVDLDAKKFEVDIQGQARPVYALRLQTLRLNYTWERTVDS